MINNILWYLYNNFAVTLLSLLFICFIYFIIWVARGEKCTCGGIMEWTGYGDVYSCDTCNRIERKHD